MDFSQAIGFTGLVGLEEPSPLFNGFPKSVTLASSSVPLSSSYNGVLKDLGIPAWLKTDAGQELAPRAAGAGMSRLTPQQYRHRQYIGGVTVLSSEKMGINSRQSVTNG